MTKKVTKPVSSLCNGQVNRAAKAALKAKLARIQQVVDVAVKIAEDEEKK